MDSFPDIVRVATGRLKPANLYLATVQKMGVTSYRLKDVLAWIEELPEARSNNYL